MAELDMAQSSRAELNTSVQDYSVAQETLDTEGPQKETYWDFSDAAENIGYYKNIPEFKQAVDALAMWTAGKGYIADGKTAILLDNITGWGEDSFQSIMQDMIIMKKVCGDAFAEIMRSYSGKLMNLKPISPERVRIVVDNQGVILRYDIRQKSKDWKAMQPNQILHLCNNRVADEIHGTSVLKACKWVIDARNEAMDTERKLRRRQLALGILYVDTENKTKRDALITQYQDAINKGDMLVLPDKVARIEDTGVRPQSHIDWIGYLENFFYQAVGVPKIILGGSQEFTEASSKVGYLTFEQVYMTEQRLLEQDLWNQLAVKIEFERPVSLKEPVQESEAANTGQVGFQPKEAGINMERE